MKLKPRTPNEISLNEISFSKIARAPPSQEGINRSGVEALITSTFRNPHDLLRSQDAAVLPDDGWRLAGKRFTGKMTYAALKMIKEGLS
ncbi:hypothetical protein CDAR_218341 [Caerostris darwini]|uniref:Uncharacterized protein n=1 Tax=Caerostris darwini TaxID=1538125 RepID=A0AAV4RB06_9ARAC|nr:hypothetical protein CDAR_218341 [Caerostris darwini]